MSARPRARLPARFPVRLGAKGDRLSSCRLGVDWADRRSALDHASDQIPARLGAQRFGCPALTGRAPPPLELVASQYAGPRRSAPCAEPLGPMRNEFVQLIRWKSPVSIKKSVRRMGTSRCGAQNGMEFRGVKWRPGAYRSGRNHPGSRSSRTVEGRTGS